MPRDEAQAIFSLIKPMGKSLQFGQLFAMLNLHSIASGSEIICRDYGELQEVSACVQA